MDNELKLISYPKRRHYNVSIEAPRHCPLFTHCETNTHTAEEFMDWEKHFPVMIIDDELKSDTAEGKILRSIIAEVEGMDLTVIQASTINDGKRHFISQPEICCILMDWDIKGTPGPGELVAFIRKRNTQIPIFLLTEKMTVKKHTAFGDQPHKRIYLEDGRHSRFHRRKN